MRVIEVEGIGMLRITVQKDRQSARLVLEGALAGAWVKEVRTAWQRFSQETVGGRVVDLAGVSRVDSEGKRLLTHMWKEGATLRAGGCYITSIVNEIVNAR